MTRTISCVLQFICVTVESQSNKQLLKSELWNTLKTYLYYSQSNFFAENTHICSLLQISFSFFTGPKQHSTESSVLRSSVNNAIKLHAFYLSELFSLCNWICWDVVSPSASHFSLLCIFSWVFKSPSELSLIWSKSGKHIKIIWEIQKQKSVTEWKMHVCCVRKATRRPLVWKWVTCSGNEDIHSLSGWE